MRRKSGGVVRFERAKSLLAAEFVHTSSRLAQDQEAGGIPDPQLHSHLVVFAAERNDGKLAAIESRQLYRSARENGAWYRAELAANLRELGLPIERRTGKDERYFEVGGVPEQLASRWSARSEDVDRAARLFRQRYGREPRAGELGSLTTATRGSKSAADRLDVNERVEGGGRGARAEPGARRGAVRASARSPAGESVDLRAELLGEVTRERSMIDERELRAKAYELAAGACRPRRGRRADRRPARDPASWSGSRTASGRPAACARWSRPRSRSPSAAPPRAPRHSVSGPCKQARREIGKEIHGSLTAEQREALETITGPGGISLLVGRAGTGKGVVISTAARAWQLEGYEVIGTAVAGATAQRLKDDASLDRSYTADGLINGVEKGRIELGPQKRRDHGRGRDGRHRAPRPARQAHRPGQRASSCSPATPRSSARSAPAGSSRSCEDRVPTAELTEVHRANHEWERRAWEQVRNGEPGPALAAYQAHDRLHVHDTRAEAAEAMVADWDKARRPAPRRRAVMITDASNAERDQINAMAQERRAAAGELGSHRVELPGKPYGLPPATR